MENNSHMQRNLSRRPKMSIENRAKQFAPFSALRGLPDELASVEKIIVPKAELSPYMEEELNRSLSSLKPGDMAEIVYFSDGEYIKTTGLISRIDAQCRMLQIVDKKIAFDDIYSIKGSKQD